MTYPNPHYDPEWQATCDYHFAEAKRLQGEVHRLAAGGAETYDAYRAAEAEFKRHHQAGMATYRQQHKTVQEYAAWVFRSFSVNMGIYDATVFVPEVDFDTLRTVEEVDAAWSHHRHLAETAANDQRLRLPIGQPEGMTAFADAASPSLTRAWREFTPRDLCPDGYPGTSGVWTITTTDEQSDGWHIGFKHPWGSRGISVTNAIERLASAVYREASAIAAQHQSGRVGPGLWIGRLLGRKPALLDPWRFHFYDHTPPAPGGSLREDFSRVVLRFGDGEFKDPECRHYRVIPEAIQSARFELARNATAMEAAALPMITDERPGA